MAVQSATPPVTLPIDFDNDDIGINFTLTYSNSSELDNNSILNQIDVISDADNNLNALTQHGRTIFMEQTDTIVSNIKLGGKIYRVVAHAGNGTYGSVCIVASPIPGTTKEQRYVLKEQASGTSDSDISVIKEAMINHILHKAVPSFTPIFHKIFYS